MMEVIEFIKWVLGGSSTVFFIAKGLQEVVTLISMSVDLKRKLANRGNDDEQK